MSKTFLCRSELFTACGTRSPKLLKCFGSTSPDIFLFPPTKNMERGEDEVWGAADERNSRG